MVTAYIKWWDHHFWLAEVMGAVTIVICVVIALTRNKKVGR